MKAINLGQITLFLLIFNATFGSDVINSKSSPILWNKKHLTYSVFGDVSARDQTRVESVLLALSAAFREWENNSCFTFKHLQRSKLADIKIIFTNDKYQKNRQSSPFEEGFSHHSMCQSRIKSRYFVLCFNSLYL